jgi:hypothetical protein
MQETGTEAERAADECSVSTVVEDFLLFIAWALSVSHDVLLPDMDPSLRHGSFSPSWILLPVMDFLNRRYVCTSLTTT